MCEESVWQTLLLKEAAGARLKRHVKSKFSGGQTDIYIYIHLIMIGRSGEKHDRAVAILSLLGCIPCSPS